MISCNLFILCLLQHVPQKPGQTSDRKDHNAATNGTSKALAPTLPTLSPGHSQLAWVDHLSVEDHAKDRGTPRLPARFHYTSKFVCHPNSFSSENPKHLKTSQNNCNIDQVIQLMVSSHFKLTHAPSCPFFLSATTTPSDWVCPIFWSPLKFPLQIGVARGPYKGVIL